MTSLLNTVTSFLCATVVLKFDGDEVITSRSARGTCAWCCPVDLREDVQFLLYTRAAPLRGALLPQRSPGEAALRAGANPSRPTIVYLHGFSERAAGPSSTAIKNAYLDTGDYNVILVDWGSLSAAPWYAAAVRNSRLVGRVLAKFLLALDTPGGLPLNNVHVIGFSLGAEASAFAGKAMPANRRIPRITGLDPAFPLYNLAGRSGRLADGDAVFVDVIHTDAGILGFPTPMGDADFYPNGGATFQPGCRAEELLTSRRGFMLSGFLSCSHQRAWKYYAESVRNPHAFPATRCPRWKGLLPPCSFRADNYMGILATPSSKGRFYLETEADAPFSKAA